MINLFMRVIASMVFLTTTAFAAGGQPVQPDDDPEHQRAALIDKIADHYADLAFAAYQDSLRLAERLHDRIVDLTEQPDAQRLRRARQAWIEARVPYQQTEVYRFGNPLVDGWEGKVNAWPLDEAFIDYVASPTDNAVNIIAHRQLQIDGATIDASQINARLLNEVLNEIGGIETNVAIGYHAIEFLLWGQDLNNARMAPGQRPASDFSVDRCTGGHCARRSAYLLTVSELLVSELHYITGAWADNGQARAELSASVPLSAILTGMGDLSFGELAGERLRLGLLLHDQEEEHDCFSDNTHNSHYYNVLGIENVYLGRYKRIDGELVQGAGLTELVARSHPALDQRLRGQLSQSLDAAQVLVDRALAGEPYDWLIDESNPEGHALIETLIDRLAAQAETISEVSSTLGLEQKTFHYFEDSALATEPAFQ